MLRIPYDELYTTLVRAMRGLGLAPERAAHCARLFAETTRDGVYTHGLNRFPRFAASIANGSVNVNAEPTKTAGMGAIERWDGHRSVGNLNASASIVSDCGADDACTRIVQNCNAAVGAVLNGVR